ncbi:MAG: tyrosine-protein phosphatase [Alphaproteobacteria bacterium]|nr:tyrosine-protein phosphatase [Alphaproteobacteria bacterium]
MTDIVDEELARRLLPLEGGVNFRDIGGYPAAYGRRVKWGRLFRSGTMARLTEADRAHLAERGIRTVIDFRTESEHAHEPNEWGMGLGEGYWRRPHDETFGNWSDLDPARLGTERDAEKVLEAGFRKLPEQQAQAYAEMFRRLAAGHVPAVIHCTAGKDRTGGGAALILAMLGVPREHIVADFLLTQRAFKAPTALSGARRNPDPKYQRFAEMKREVLAVFSSSRPSFIAAFLDSLDAQHGGIENYAATLGFTAADREAIRAGLLE